MVHRQRVALARVKWYGTGTAGQLRHGGYVLYLQHSPSKHVRTPEPRSADVQQRFSADVWRAVVSTSGTKQHTRVLEQGNGMLVKSWWRGSNPV